ncbi:hypothetical protein KSF_005290 [Reticulibacter mediterranei]|uniref:Uncharacterized protein n=1 Tax=Reticulibacter mediterranei TaxID=2778369 RepID=A0A8J3IHS5_9CHLR|nr:hypothetical protein [Reticulibacter mediterranei]GHO90481.1 hypothetical protein KSF_005290 [Reticulibacter mediterranei]
MNSQALVDILLVIQIIITLLISVQAFYHYVKTKGDILFSVGLSMSVIALGGITGLLEDTLLANSTFNSLWFRYIGQTISYLFILLISLRGSEAYIQRLKWWHIGGTILLLALLVFTPLIPVNSDPTILALLSGSRSAVCFAILLNYTAIFMNKRTRFSLLMGLAFLFITFGIWVYTMEFFLPHLLYLDYVGDGIRILGLVILLAALFLG